MGTITTSGQKQLAPCPKLDVAATVDKTVLVNVSKKRQAFVRNSFYKQNRNWSSFPTPREPEFLSETALPRSRQMMHDLNACSSPTSPRLTIPHTY